jgi:hypothetical protein
MNSLYIPKFNMPKFNINCNKIKIQIVINIKKFQLDRDDNIW